MVTSELFNRTGAAMERTLLKTLLILFTVMLTVSQGKNVRCFFLHFILFTFHLGDMTEERCGFVLSQQDRLILLFFLTKLQKMLYS